MKKSFVIALALSASFALSGCSPTVSPNTTVKVFPSKGHGSGFYIGGGAFLTAAHVVGDEKEIKVRFADTTEMGASVLWVSKEYDVALAHVEGLDAPGSSLSCEVAKVGDEVVAIGNPMLDEFVTTWGKISALPVEKGSWKSVYRVQVPIARGSSGGPLFNSRGQVIGINVGVGIFPVGMGGSAYGISFVVPSSEICKLLARP